MAVITFTTDVSSERNRFTYKFEDLGISEEEWNEMSESDKNKFLQDICDQEEQPFWVLDSWSLK